METLEALIEDIKSDPEMAKQAVEAEKGGEDAVIAFMKANGVTGEDIEEGLALQKSFETVEGELSDAQLEVVSGGKGSSTTTCLGYHSPGDGVCVGAHCPDGLGGTKGCVFYHAY